MLLTGTDGEEITWSNGRPGEKWAPDLWTYKPGDKAPTQLFKDPNRSAQLNTLVVHNGAFAFEEKADNKDGSGSWRLWYVASRTAKPVVIDSNQGDPRDLPVPAVWPALTDTQLTWNTIHMLDGEPTWMLRTHDFRTGVTRTLLTGHLYETEYWDPNVDEAGNLLYSTAEYGPDRLYDHAQFHVYMANLADDPIKPRRLDKDGLASQPLFAGDGDTVVWKGVERPYFLGSWGQLYRYSIKRDDVRMIPFGSPQGVSDATAGDRFVSAWEWDLTRLHLYDLQADALIEMEKYDAKGPFHVSRPWVNKDFLVFVRSNRDLPGGKNKWLCYAKLPPLGA